MQTYDYHGSIRFDVLPHVPPANRLIDVGGGTGANARHIKRIGQAQWVGVLDQVADNSSGELDCHSNIDLNDVEAIAQFMQSIDSVDTVLLLDVLEHLVDPWKTVEAFAAHLPAGARVVASVPNVRHLSASVRLMFGNDWTYTEAGILDRTHLRFFVRKTAVDLMERGGLRAVKVVPSPITRRLWKVANALTLGLLRSFFTLQYFVISEKTK